MSKLQGQLAELTLARVREFYREPGAVFWAFGFPLLLAIGLGVAFRNRPADAPRVAMVAPINTETVKALEAAGVVVITPREGATPAEILKRGQVDLLIAEATPGAVTYHFDPMNDVSRQARLAVDGYLQKAKGRIDAVAITEEAVTERGARYIDFLLPGILGMNLMSSSMWGIGYTIVWERKKKLLKRLAATPMRRSNYLLSYFLSRLIFLFVEIVALVLFGRFVFDVAVQGSYLSLALMAFLGATAFAGLSLLIAARVQSIEAVGGWMNFVMLPMWLLSGTFFSYERFPEVVRPFIQLLPLTAINDGLRGIINYGSSLSAVGMPVLILTAWTVICFTIALKIFRWQ